MAAEDAAVPVGLVHHHVAQLLEQLEPRRMVGEDRRVEHVRVGDHHLPRRPDPTPDRGGGVSVVDIRLERQLGVACQLPDLDQLVAPECLGREQVERPRGRILRDGLEHGQVVAQRLAGRGRGRDQHVIAGAERLHRLELVAVERGHAPPLQRGPEARVEPRRDVDQVRGSGRQDPVGDDRVRHVRGRQQAVERLSHGHRLVDAHPRSPRGLAPCQWRAAGGRDGGHHTDHMF
jgi:hypothetical protein